ncbi:hypothetical protein [Furfurilactobacillus milii]|uniref:Uncharacterized protein n=1 Tax=Furfurilactobacillus milii TaxID=2888272 RepID=A0A6N9I4M9_9LACO|nr:hypothetical protein [Furfurilactobacillus milii]MYV17253.1 hypothetical protein [Furfurilactobacillus milii]
MKISKARKDLNKKINDAWQTIVMDDAQFGLRGNKNLGFYFGSKDFELIRQYNSQEQQDLTRINPWGIPNDISGSILTAKVLVIMKNMGTAADEYSFDKKSERPFYTQSNQIAHTTIQGNAFELAMHSNNKHDFMQQGRPRTMAKVIEELCILQDPKKAVEYLKGLERDLSNILLSQRGKSASDSQKYINIQNFYLFVVYPLLQLKFSFNSYIAFKPLTLLVDPYYSGIGNYRAKNVLRFQRNSVTWDNYWQKYLDDDLIQFMDGDVSFLKREHVTRLSDVMLLQAFPYRSFRGSRLNTKILKPIYERQNLFLKAMLEHIREYNLNNENDVITVDFARPGGRSKSVAMTIADNNWTYTHDPAIQAILSNAVVKPLTSK